MFVPILVLLLALTNNIGAEGGVERVLLLQESGTPSSSSYARLVNTFPALDKFTVCYRIRLHRFREESTLMSYSVSDTKDNELRFDHRTTGYRVAVHSAWASTKIQTPMLYWSHFCFLYDNSDNSWMIYQEGDKKKTGSMPPNPEKVDGSGAYVIGQEQDNFGGGFERDQSYSGEITQLNFWIGHLDDTTIRDLAQCRSQEEGSALAWSQMRWNVSEVSWLLRNTTEVCSKDTRSVVFFPDRFNLKEALNLCKIVGGRLFVPINDYENKWVYNVTEHKAGQCSGSLGTNYLWLGANDIKNEGTWVKSETLQPLQYQGKWRNDGPNGGKAENCLVMLYREFAGLWSDIACLDTYRFCTACEFDYYTMMYLKGKLICETSPFNTKYLLYKDINERPSLTGIFHSDIFWDNETQSWILLSRKNPSAVAYWKPDRPEQYPFGKHNWTTKAEICGFKEKSQIILTLSACGDGQFTCDDGSCISLLKKCDLKVDCDDQSDEVGCSLLDIDAGYNINVPPPPLKSNTILEINISVSVIAFPVIKTQDLLFETSFKLKLTWRDIRINFLNLKNARSLNLLSQADIGKVWTPAVLFSNAHGNIFSNLDQGARVECIKSAEGVMGGPQFENEVTIFSGVNNSLEISQLYTADYSCDFNLAMFPFDAQTCYIIFTLTSASSTYMVLKPSLIEFNGSRELIEYTIGEVIDVKRATENEFSQIHLGVHFIRRSGFYLLTLYIPTVLLVIIAYSSYFFNPIDFNSKIIVALTALLVMSSLFTQTSNSLPKTSYFKLVDIWLFFSVVIIFIVIIFLTLAEFFSFESLLRGSSEADRVQPIGPLMTEELSSSRLRGDTVFEGHKNSAGKTVLSTNMKILIAGRVVTPLIYLIFNIIYWSAALIYVMNLKRQREKQQF